MGMLMNVRRLTLIFTVVLAAASTPGWAQTQAASDQDACGEYQRADKELNRVYRQVLVDYQADGRFIEKLKVAQRAWLPYRDAQLQALYPAREPQKAYGSVHKQCRCQAATELTLQRTEELRRWVMGVEEGDVCAGSIRVRGTPDG